MDRGGNLEEAPGTPASLAWAEEVRKSACKGGYMGSQGNVAKSWKREKGTLSDRVDGGWWEF